MAIPLTLQSAANAAVMLAAGVAFAGVAFVGDAPAAQPNRTAQQGASFHRAAPVLRPSPVQYGAPHAGNAGRPVHVAPAFTPPQRGFHINPESRRINPALPPNNPGALRPGLPLNNPSALRPNFPPDNPGRHEPGLPANPGGTGLAAPLNGPNLIQRGAIPSPEADTRPVAGPSPVSQSSVSQPVALRPLSKAPPGGLPQTRPAFPAVQAHDRFWPLHKDSRFIWLHGQRRLFTPVALLGIVLIGDSYWYPDAFVSAEGPACTGYTADGCRLQWRPVDLEDGGTEPQCVQYCPQAGPPPAQVATLPPPAPIPEGGACQTTIYSEPNFRGNSAPTGDSQPALSPSGWRNEIASIVVRAGIWDFFADENFSGESLRLGPGTYPTLAPQWTRHIGSFMCVEPGQPPA